MNSLAESLALLPESERNQHLKSLSESESRALLHSWRFWARPSQLQPGSPGAAIARNDWIFWLVQAGRGFGKTRTGAETVREWATNPRERILMAGPTAADVRETMVEGPSGLLSCYPPSAKPVYNPSRHLVSFPSGAVGITRSADEPERLRGPQFTKFWFDELCACRFAKESWDQLAFGFRLPGDKLRGIITTTPKPIKVYRDLVAMPATVLTRGSSYDNRSAISEFYYSTVIKPYEGTRLGRQEIEGELIDDVPGALWTRALIDATRIREIKWELIAKIVIAIDPAVSAGEESAETGIIVALLTVSGHAIILDDLTLRGKPIEWAKVAEAAFVTRKANEIIGEVNNGGDLVERNITALNPNLPFRAVRAARGKFTRAEPVATLYERGMVHHYGSLPYLEDQMCSYVPGAEKSPDRLDAMVWAVWALLIDPAEQQGVIQLGTPVTISPM